MKHVPTGQRKIQHAREMALILTLAFMVAGYLKVPGELFAAYVSGLAGFSGFFVWGNIRENQAAAKASPVPAPAP